MHGPREVNVDAARMRPQLSVELPVPVDEAAWGYWAVPIGLLIIACIHVASYVGQRLATAQMYELRGRLEWVVARQFGAVPDREETASEPECSDSTDIP